MDDAVLSVSALNQYVADSLRADPFLRSLRLRGQVSGFKPHYSGHWYFTLKDQDSTIDCVLFRQYAQRASFRPENGDEVVVHGSVGLYSATGRYQFYCDSIRPQGIGLLWQRFEELKRQLQQEGLFDSERKRPLPAHPARIAVVTSETGAVLHDICRVAAARDPAVEIVLVPSPVQGGAAAAVLAQRIRLAGSLPGVDALIVGRGGGSMEDLWCFNEAEVAYAIAACPVPVVSAVGHETDFTIADFAADVRAATPSNAAELLVPSRSEQRQQLALLRARLDRQIDELLGSFARRLSQDRRQLTALAPAQHIAAMRRRTAELRAQLGAAMEGQLHRLRPQTAMAQLRLDAAMDALLQGKHRRLSQCGARLSALNPAAVLERGYVLAMDGERVVTRAAEAPEHMRLRFADGGVAVRRETDSEQARGTDEKDRKAKL